MSNAPTVPSSTIRFILKPDDQSCELGQVDLELLADLHAAIELQLATGKSDEPSTATPGRDSGFSCEWWPPN
jgi:hypothetical protein